MAVYIPTRHDLGITHTSPTSLRGEQQVFVLSACDTMQVSKHTGNKMEK